MFQIQEVSHSNPLENYFHITSKHISCKIYPNLGASIQEFVCKNIPIIKGFEKVEDYKTQHTSSILCPFPGRVGNGVYTYKGQQYQLEQNENNRNNAIHGKVAHESFELIDSESSKEHAVLSFACAPQNPCKGFPFSYEITVLYTIREDSILLDFNIHNKGGVSFPFGLGWHPYFKSSDLANSILTFTSSKEILCDPEMIPTGEKLIDFSKPMKISDQHFDTCYILDDNTISMKTDDYSLEMQVLHDTPQFIQIFTPDSRDCIALEPMTCPPDAFNNRRGLLELSPKEVYEWSIHLGFQVS